MLARSGYQRFDCFDAEVIGDRRTNMEFQSFSPENRVEVSLKDLDLSILGELLELAPRFEKVRLELKEKKQVEAMKELCGGDRKVFKRRREDKTRWE